MASRESSIRTLRADASSKSLGASALNVSCRSLLSWNYLLLNALSGLEIVSCRAASLGIQTLCPLTSLRKLAQGPSSVDMRHE